MPILRFPYDPARVAAVKAVPGMRWDAGIRAWIGSQDAVDTATGAHNPPTIVAAKDFGLRPYQDLGAAHCLSAATGVLLADDMGLGKSAQSLAAARELACRTLIVCPSYVRGVWCRPVTGELAKWWPAALVMQIAGTKPAPTLPDVDVVVIHYDILHAHAAALATWLQDGTLIFDEIHYLQNERSRRSQAARQVAAAAKYRIGLSGTPLTNRPRNLWNIVDTLSPGRFGNFFQYAQRYCGAHQDRIDMRNGDVRVVWDFNGSSNEAELQKRLSYFMLRRTKADVQLALPPMTRQVIEIDVAAKYRPRPSVGVVKDRTALRAALARTADGKLSQVAEMVADHAADHKVIVFCWRRAVADAIAGSLAEGGIQAFAVHGGLTHPQRDAAIEQVRASPTPAVLCCTIDTCSTGIDLSFADVAIVAELTYEPHELLQAESRLHRYGQQNPTLIQYIIAKNSIDELVADAVVAKLDVQRAVLGASAGAADDDTSGGESLGAALAHKGVDIMADLLAAVRGK